MESDLLPPDTELDPEVVDMMRLVFRAECEERPSARNLLEHPLIVSGECIFGQLQGRQSVLMNPRTPNAATFDFD